MCQRHQAIVGIVAAADSDVWQCYPEQFAHAIVAVVQRLVEHNSRPVLEWECLTAVAEPTPRIVAELRPGKYRGRRVDRDAALSICALSVAVVGEAHPLGCVRARARYFGEQAVEMSIR